MRMETHKPPLSAVQEQNETADEGITADTFVSGSECNRCGNIVPLRMMKEQMNVHHPIHQCPHVVENRYLKVNGRIENLLDLRAIKEGLEEIGDLDELESKLDRITAKLEAVLEMQESVEEAV